ncbi:MAG: lipopolysaccharide heptosyltransferase II [PVC group bacterium]
MPDIHNILIRSPNWVGDTIFALPAVRRLRETFPAARLSILAAGSLAPLWELAGEFDEIIACDLKGGRRDLARKFALIRMLRSRRFDLAVILPRSFESALWMFLAGIPARWGYAEEGRSFLLTRASRSPRGYRRTHRSDYYYHLIDHAAGDEPAPPGRLKISPPLLARARELVRREGGGGAERHLAGFHPRASYGPAKCWPLKKFIRLADRLVHERGMAVLLFGSGKEKKMLQAIADGVGGGAINLAGRTDLKELAALITLCRFFVANDSGPLHLAAALGVPVIGLYGSTDPAATGPRGDKARIIYKAAACSPCLKRTCPVDFACMGKITPQEVLAEIDSLLANPEY